MGLILRHRQVRLEFSVRSDTLISAIRPFGVVGLCFVSRCCCCELRRSAALVRFSRFGQQRPSAFVPRWVLWYEGHLS